MASPLLQASLSHYIAKRDIALSELDVYINRPVGVGDHSSVTAEVIKLFAELESAESVIQVIRDIIASNTKTYNEISESMKKANNELTNSAPSSTTDNITE